MVRLASLPFAPDICLAALRHLGDRYPEVIDNFRLPSGFNPTLANRRKFGRHGWVSEGHYGLDQGIVVMMIENHRSRLIWELMRSSPAHPPRPGQSGFHGRMAVAAGKPGARWPRCRMNRQRQLLSLSTATTPN